MKISKFRLKNFKRFSDLTISKIPETSKLVLLIGANGSGKSSIFDAFSLLVRRKQGRHYAASKEYFTKNGTGNFEISVDFSNGQNIIKTDTQSDTTLNSDAFYGRPSLRIVPKISNNTPFDENVIRENRDSPDHFIEADTKFNLDILKYTQDINRALREPVFAGIQADTLQIFKDHVEPINDALNRIFNLEDAISLKIIQFEESSPNKAPTLIFQKGNSKINYDLLSHGEKQVIIILLNFVVRNTFFRDTIYYIDEMDGHLNTSLQYALIKEITENWIPENCQLWTASHALGFIEYAKDSDHSSIIDLDNLDFDLTQYIEPKPKFDDEIFAVAISKNSIAKILGNKKVVLCENKNHEFYSLTEFENYIFTDVNNASSVFLKIKRDKSLIGLRDRDFLTDLEIIELKSAFSNYKILDYYCFENYLYHPENVSLLNLPDFNPKIYIDEIAQIKRKNINILVQNIGAARNSYEEFKPGGIKKGIDVKSITDSLFSEDFESFFKYFSFKEYCGMLTQKYKIDKREAKGNLVKTPWFKSKINEILI